MMEFSKDEVMKIFYNDVCNREYIRVGREDLDLPIRCNSKSKNNTKAEKLQNDGSKPVIDVGDVDKFEDSLYAYVQKYLRSEALWTKYWIADTKSDNIMLALISIWPNATYQDYENPLELINRYSSFLDEDKLHKLLKNGREIYNTNGTSLKMKTQQNNWELETPRRFVLEAADTEGKKEFPGVHYGVHNNEAYIYAVQGTNYIQNYQKNNYENEEINQIRKTTRQEGKKDDYRGAEPLAVLSLICFLETAKKCGIKKVNIANFLPLRYDSKTELQGNEVSDEVQTASTNRLLLQIRRIMHYHSEGIKLLNVPGETGDFLSIDISAYKPKGKYIENICKNIDEGFEKIEEI